jgi:hypothetical protein
MTNAARQRALRQRREAQGLRQVLVWVPADRVEDIREIAAKMREDDEQA